MSIMLPILAVGCLNELDESFVGDLSAGLTEGLPFCSELECNNLLLKGAAQF